MYTRNYFDGTEGNMPRGYDGIALRAEEKDSAIDTSAAMIEDKPKKRDEGGILQGLLGGLNLRLPTLDKIGYEEILILGISAFLFFSADGDKECALILLALLLIN